MGTPARNLSSPLWFGLAIESWIHHLIKNVDCWSALCYANRPTKKFLCPKYCIAPRHPLFQMLR